VVDLHVAGLVHHLARRVELGLLFGNRLNDLRGRQKRTLLAVQELREHEGIHVELQFDEPAVTEILRRPQDLGQ